MPERSIFIACVVVVVQVLFQFVGNSVDTTLSWCSGKSDGKQQEKGQRRKNRVSTPTMVYDKDRRFHHPRMGNNQTQTMIQLLIKGAIRGPKGAFFRG